MSALILIIVNLKGYLFEEIWFLPDFFCYIASDQKFIFLQSEGCKSKIKVSASLASSEASLLGLQMAGCFLTVSSHGLSSCTHISGVSSSSYKDISHNGSGPYPNSLLLI